MNEEFNCHNCFAKYCTGNKINKKININFIMHLPINKNFNISFLMHLPGSEHFHIKIVNAFSGI
jgi:hypothetical protein